MVINSTILLILYVFANALVFGYKAISTVALTWHQSQDACKTQYGSSLATITSDWENSMVYNLCSSYCWLGGNDITQEGNWVWITNTGSTPINYTNWDPNPTNDIDYDCMIMIKSSSKWYNVKCMDLSNRNAVCNDPPTNYPTYNPTSSNPTSNPSNKPTNNPSKTPTNNPTNNPSFEPSIIPTQYPTSSPTNTYDMQQISGFSCSIGEFTNILIELQRDIKLSACIISCEMNNDCLGITFYEYLKTQNDSRCYLLSKLCPLHSNNANHIWTLYKSFKYECQNYPLLWTDTVADTCAQYTQQGLCYNSSIAGTQFLTPIISFASNMLSAVDVCCDCGGGISRIISNSMLPQISLEFQSASSVQQLKKKLLCSDSSFKSSEQTTFETWTILDMYDLCLQMKLTVFDAMHFLLDSNLYNKHILDIDCNTFLNSSTNDFTIYTCDEFNSISNDLYFINLYAIHNNSNNNSIFLNTQWFNKSIIYENNEIQKINYSQCSDIINNYNLSNDYFFYGTFVCEYKISPTFIPTSFPSKIPSLIPTNAPSINPTKDPTNVPTKYPSTNPTVYPTSQPSKYPTNYPSTDPTKDPTKYPSHDPSANPSNIPITDPTKFPSNDPSTNPTKDPTTDPTKYPSNYPSTIPTKDPTKYPAEQTKSPTNKPNSGSIETTSFSTNNSASANSHGLTIGDIFAIIAVVLFLPSIVFAIFYYRKQRRERIKSKQAYTEINRQLAEIKLNMDNNPLPPGTSSTAPNAITLA